MERQGELSDDLGLVWGFIAWSLTVWMSRHGVGGNAMGMESGGDRALTLPWWC